MNASSVKTMGVQLFASFPLSTYPGQHTRDNLLEEKIMKHTYPLNKRDGVSASSVGGTAGVCGDPKSIGVYKMQDVKKLVLTQESVFAPTDPLCLNVFLCMLLKNDLVLPRETAYDTKLRSAHSFEVIELNYHASPDKLLPILVEPFVASREPEPLSPKNDVRSPVIRLHREMQEILSSRLLQENESHLLLSELLDTLLHDAYIVQLLQDEFFYSNTYLSKDQNKPQNYCKFMQSLMELNRFSSRNKSLYLAATKCFVPFVSNTDSREQQHVATKNVFEQFQKLLLQIEHQHHDMTIEIEPFFHFCTGNSTPSYLDIKLASYIVPMLLFNADDEMTNFVTKSCPKIVEHASQVLQYFI